MVGGAGVAVVDAEQHLAALEPARGDARGVVAGEPVVHRPGGAVEAAAVHRADDDLVLERAEQQQLLDDVGRAEHAVDVGVAAAPRPAGRAASAGRPSPSGRRRRRGHRGPGGRPRPGRGCRGRRGSGRAGAGRRTPWRSRPGRPRGSRAGRATASSEMSVADRVSARERSCGVLTIDRRRARPTVGMASAQARREATRAPAALAYSAQRAGSQPDSSPCTSAPPNASPAPRPQTTSTGCGGTTVAPSAVATSTPSPPIFTSASSTPRSSSRAAASCGSLVPTATSTSARLPTVTVTWSSIASYSARASSGDGQNISRQSRSRMVQRPEPGSGRGRRASIVELGGAGRLDAHAGAGHPQDRHVAHHVPRDVVVGDRQVGRDRRAVEEQRRVLGRVELAEDHRGLQARPRCRRTTRRRRSRPAPRGRSRRSRPARPW